MKAPVDPRKVKEIADQKVVSRLSPVRDSAFNRFPLLFTLLGAFGVVATLYGFERLIDKSELLSDSPFILLGTGILTLILTGSLYKKL
ncbi:hypothetical protein HYW36_02565 [Candidatus Saccharibacteria bacterium]|nr:hypothetical protein [Candidatus Saccharibacteria bacterium]